MGTYSIGEVSELLHLKPHILRYWEQEVALLSPRKDGAGHRTYTSRDLQLLYRLKYLVYTRKFTVEGASRKIIQELSGSDADAKARVQETRDLLLRFRERLRTERRKPTAGPVDSVSSALLAWTAAQSTGARRAVSPQFYRPRIPRAELARRGSDRLASGCAALVTRLDTLPAELAELPYIPVGPVRGATLLELWAEQVRSTAYRFGRTPLWIITVEEGRADKLRSHLDSKAYYNVSPKLVTVLPIPELPLLTAEGDLALAENGRIRTYPGGLIALLWAMSRSDDAVVGRKQAARLYSFASVQNLFLQPLSPTIIALADETGLCFRAAYSAEGARNRKVRLSNAFAVSQEFLEGPWESAIDQASSLSSDHSEADNSYRWLRLSASALAGCCRASAMQLPPEAMRLEGFSPRSVGEAAQELVRAMALSEARMRGEAQGKKGRRRYAEIDVLYADGPDEASRRFAACDRT